MVLCVSIIAVLGLAGSILEQTIMDLFPPVKTALKPFAIAPAHKAHLRMQLCESTDQGTYKVNHNKVIMGVPCAAATGAL